MRVRIHGTQDICPQSVFKVHAPIGPAHSARFMSGILPIKPLLRARCVKLVAAGQLEDGVRQGLEADRTLGPVAGDGRGDQPGCGRLFSADH